MCFFLMLIETQLPTPTPPSELTGSLKRGPQNLKTAMIRWGSPGSDLQEKELFPKVRYSRVQRKPSFPFKVEARPGSNTLWI